MCNTFQQLNTFVNIFILIFFIVFIIILLYKRIKDIKQN